MAKAKMCGCLGKINARKDVMESNTQVCEMHVFSKRTCVSLPQIEVRKLDTKVRRRPKMVIPTYCPFCGIKYPDMD